MSTPCCWFQETGLTALMMAVKENKLVVAERLIELGANVNERDKVSCGVILEIVSGNPPFINNQRLRNS